jgi:hypothetical protein
LLAVAQAVDQRHPREPTGLLGEVAATLQVALMLVVVAVLEALGLPRKWQAPLVRMSVAAPGVLAAAAGMALHSRQVRQSPAMGLQD